MHLREILLSVEKIWVKAQGSEKQNLATFHRNAYCVTELLIDQLKGKLETGNTKKVIIDLSDISTPNPDNVTDVAPFLFFLWPFSLGNYFEKPDAGKKLMILQVLQDALLWIGELRHWDEEIIRRSCVVIAESGISNKRFWKDGKSWKSPNREISLKVFYDFDLGWFRIYVVFYSKSDVELGRKLIVDEVPMEGPFVYYWKKINWVSNEEVLLQSKDGRDFKISLDDVKK